MSSRYIVSVHPADGRGEAVVIEVLREGIHPLDVRLVGCEGESPYVTSIRHSNLAELRLKFKGTDGEWAAILSHFLLMKQPEIEDAHLLHGVSMVYTLKNGALEISFRQDVQTIKVTLGEIVLPQDDEFEFNPFDWARASALAHAQTLQHMAELQARVSSEQQTTAKLNAQLDEFIKTKNEAEAAMLRQFMTLLNEKKRKIRDQNRLLAGAKLDQPSPVAATATATATVQPTRGHGKTRKPGASSTYKRKASSQAAEPSAVADSAPESNSDQMEIDQAKTEEGDEEEMPEPVTPEQSDDETDDESNSAPQARTRSSETRGVNSTVAQSSTEEGSETKGVPPPRVLPFSKKPMATRSRNATKRASRSAGHGEDDDDDDETDDEEL